jgi:UDP-2,3-diacylglucosamine pyrophosphatase LpxH
VYRRILGSLYDNEKENWRILTNKEIYASLNRLCWFGHVHRIEENRIPKRLLYINLGAPRLRGRPRKI